ncbi:hypothetical protein [Thiospirillum jenense]|uniref:Uncharacterized protein n=1 Tax=Thiospirillum jenense TaxID=1653858 RepID=A0A839HF06_9GAMM|nr:hypothetical protein [Thiospirillum jenense]MBB1127054.1 hypothetical protein [Thiospirillum jenense]
MGSSVGWVAHTPPRNQFITNWASQPTTFLLAADEIKTAAMGAYWVVANMAN